MRTFIKYFSVLFLSLWALESCSLDESKESFVSPDEFYNTKAECLAGLNSCYMPLKSIYSYTFGIATEGVTDLMYIASGTQDAQLDISPAKPRLASTVWPQCYYGVRNSTSCIVGIEKSPIPAKVKAPLIAEGKIMRAYYYYLLTSFFGDVPFYEDNVNSVEMLKKVAKLPRMSAVETRDSLVKELMRCVPDCDQVRTYDVENNRSGAAMGWMLIAKMSMWNKDWSTALTALQHLETIYGSLDQYPLTDIPFRYKNTPESIFEIQHTYELGGLSYASNFACICMPYPRSANSSVFDGVEIKEIGDQCTTWSPLRPNSFFTQALMPKASPDLRKDMEFVYSWEGHNFKNATSRPWLGPKFWCPNMISSYDSNNYKVFRYADAILMMAECYMELQDYDNSVKYLNIVKSRAALSDYVFRTEARLEEEIRRERGRELFGEFQRKFDLVRWGIWYQATYDNTDYSSVKENILPCFEYYPIPDTEVTYSGGALDNKAYEKYGL